jgi:hypothetical protein
VHLIVRQIPETSTAERALKAARRWLRFIGAHRTVSNHSRTRPCAVKALRSRSSSSSKAWPEGVSAKQVASESFSAGGCQRTAESCLAARVRYERTNQSLRIIAHQPGQVNATQPVPRRANAPASAQQSGRGRLGNDRTATPTRGRSSGTRGARSRRLARSSRRLQATVGEVSAVQVPLTAAGGRYRKLRDRRRKVSGDDPEPVARRKFRLLAPVSD